MATNTLQSLQSAPGLAALASRLGGVDSFFHDPEHAQEIPATIARFLKQNPSLADVKIESNPDIPGGYYPGKDTITLGVVNPAVVGHETAHAENVRKAPLYRKILSIANTVASINNIAAIPAMLAIRAFVGDPETRREILNILAGTSAAVAAPGLVEEFGASAAAVKNAPNKLQAIKTLIPAFLQHALTSSMPVGVYQLGKFM
jgi:hypothetical protein